MILFPEIDAMERTPTGLVLSFVVPASLEYFEGHFPAVPLLPGVVQVGWAIGLARKYLQVDRPFRSLAGVKFTRVIQPGANLSLSMEFDDRARQLRFAYAERGEPCSEGRVLFG